LSPTSCSVKTLQDGNVLSQATVTSTNDGIRLSITAPVQATVDLQYGKVYGPGMYYGCNWSGCYISFNQNEIDLLQYAISVGGLGAPTVMRWLTSEYGWFTADIVSALGLVGAIVTVISGGVIYLCDDYWHTNGVYFAIGGQGIVIWCNPVGSGGY